MTLWMARSPHLPQAFHPTHPGEDRTPRRPGDLAGDGLPTLLSRVV